ncbi:DUF6545 domain-containing protein [Streptomyces acidiscabies]|uniref:DUF6545 domain-containing protein n=1 Tax=Streptomyces acidiscabies TaxID=42234 RepID=UPI0009623354|nr:DUF6545 domain-containing protein [Streptomyces acidiscabies]GAV43296.1 hypothetical protein Saa2_06248 [Streptomyces acidiscabies]
MRVDPVAVSFWVPTVMLCAALAIKLPTIVRLWRDPLLRAVGGLLLLACAVFVFVAPSTISWTNRVTGVPNISAPWCYSLLTAFAGSCLLLIIAWRNGLSDLTPSTRRAMWWVIGVYSGVIVALWVLFLLADVPVERVRDLDTYYANTPFMREEIVLYLLAHCVAVLVTSRLIWNWVRTEGLDAWLRSGLVFLVIGYALNLVYDALKLTAVVARWTGNDLDLLSTTVAPLAACLSAVLVALGFILPHTGQYLRERWLLHRTRIELRPLYVLLKRAQGSGVPFTLRAGAELRLIRRETFIRDVLLTLTRRLDGAEASRAYEAAAALGHPAERARALAAAVAIEDAVTRPADGAWSEAADHPDPTALLQTILDVSRALRRPDEVAAVRAAACRKRAASQELAASREASALGNPDAFREPAATRTPGTSRKSATPQEPTASRKPAVSGKPSESNRP